MKNAPAPLPGDSKTPDTNQSPLEALDWLQGGAGLSPAEGDRLKTNIESERLANRRWQES